MIRRPCGALGASALITAAITAFYGTHRARGPDFFVYPDYFLFHVGLRSSYYAGGMRVFRFVASGIEEVGHYIDSEGNNFWRVESSCRSTQRPAT